MSHPTSEYPPGSIYAVEAGCRCRGKYTDPHTHATRFVTQADCPLHGAAYEEHVLSESYERMPPRNTHTVAVTFLPAVRGVPLPMDADECEYRAEEREGMRNE